MTSLHDELAATLGNGYTLERELGGGGMSRVFVALWKSAGPDLQSAVADVRSHSPVATGLSSSAPCENVHRLSLAPSGRATSVCRP